MFCQSSLKQELSDRLVFYFCFIFNWPSLLGYSQKWTFWTFKTGGFYRPFTLCVIQTTKSKHQVRCRCVCCYFVIHVKPHPLVSRVSVTKRDLGKNCVGTGQPRFIWKKWRRRKHTQSFYCFSGICLGPPGWVGTRKVKPGRVNQFGFTGTRDSEWQWHPLAICKSAPHPRQPRQHPTTQFFTGRMPFLPPNQQRQSTEGKALKERGGEKELCKLFSVVKLSSVFVSVHCKWWSWWWAIICVGNMRLPANAFLTYCTRARTSRRSTRLDWISLNMHVLTWLSKTVCILVFVVISVMRQRFKTTLATYCICILNLAVAEYTTSVILLMVPLLAKSVD